MKFDLMSKIAKARLIIGYLGEKDQFKWWESSFLSSSSSAFLLHPYPRTTLLAQYNGVCETALLVHDEFIGVGSNYHLYRLPVSIEEYAARLVQEPEFFEELKDSLESRDGAINTLQNMSNSSVETSIGPVKVGIFSDESLESKLELMVSHYIHAYKEGYRCFPFMGTA